jgi:hypothetical protein
VARGVLREKNGCYQLNASKSRGPVDNAGDKSGAGKAAAAESAEPAAETAAKTARTALSPPGVKKAKIRNKNVSGATGRELSPGGDNSAVLNRALAEELVGIIRLFAGSLPSRLEAPLRDWIREAGVAAVWTTLEPHLRSGPEQTRSKLEAVLNGTGRYR